MAAAVAGIVVAAVATTASIFGMGKSLAQAADQRRKASQAERDSKILMQEAKAKMQKNFYEGLTLPTEAYDRAFRGNAVQQKQAIESLQGADARTLAAGIGKVGALGMTANEAERLTMGKDLFALDLTKAENAQKINDELVGMDVGQAKDQMTMAGDLREASAASTLSGIQAGISGLQSAASAAPLYLKSGGDRRAGQFAKSDEFANMPRGGKWAVNPQTGKPRMEENPDWKIKPANYDPALKEGDTGYIPEYRPEWQEHSAKDSKRLWGEHMSTIFPKNKDFRTWRKNDFDMSTLTPNQLAEVKRIFGTNPY
tara:strand:- start:338 stop:1276 length:939 start_codon:yes stop_codon:yes gene_type:complete